MDISKGFQVWIRLIGGEDADAVGFGESIEEALDEALPLSIKEVLDEALPLRK